MARLKTNNSGVRIEGNEGRFTIFTTDSGFCVVETGESPEFTVKQARRLRDWLTDRCDEIEGSKGDE